MSNVSRHYCMQNNTTLSIGVEYQPILHTDTLEVFGYEALARFYDRKDQNIPPITVFEKAKACGEQYTRLGYQCNALQLHHAPKDYPIFVNIDPTHCDIDDLIVLLQSHHKIKVVAEITETNMRHNKAYAQKLCNTLKQDNIKVALDDLFAVDTHYIDTLVSKCDYIKIDKEALRKATECDIYYAKIEKIVKSKQPHQAVILEGVESETDLHTASKLEADFVQGYLFRDQFFSISD